MAVVPAISLAPPEFALHPALDVLRAEAEAQDDDEQHDPAANSVFMWVPEALSYWLAIKLVSVMVLPNAS